jgi:hypothetical protein
MIINISKILLVLAFLSFSNYSFGYLKNLYFVPSSTNEVQQGFIRFTNDNGVFANITISGTDDSGLLGYSSISFSIPPNGSKHINSDDIELGNNAKGLTGAFGIGNNNWRLSIASDVHVDVSAFIRTSEGFLTQIDSTIDSIGGGIIHTVPIFNPASNTNQVSKLRLVNLADSPTTFGIMGIDDDGVSSPNVFITVNANSSKTLTSQDIENGASELTGSIGDGKGKWQLKIVSSQRAVVMSFLEAPGGYLSNLSNLGTEDITSQNVTCGDINGASIFSDENQPVYLGFFGSNYAQDSVNNSYGNYGSDYSGTSIRSSYGQYGSDYGVYSHLNSVSSQPPIVVKSGKTLFRLTTNSIIAGGISLATIDSACSFTAASKANTFAAAN